MKIFADASAIVAIMVGEPEAEALTALLDQSTERLYCAVGQWEAVAALARIFRVPIAIAWQRLESFGVEAELRLVPIGETESRIAIQAFEAYGKGRHRASLNMADCFAYACAKANDAKLLYKGDDFAHTDMA